jgi:hypothetical protein
MAHNIFEFNTDPSTMSEMTSDTSLNPEELLIAAEEEGYDIISILEETQMSKKEETTTKPTLSVDNKLPLLNEQPGNCIGVLHMTPGMHAHLQNEAERLRRAQVSNLWWIAAFAGEYGVQPTIEDVFNTAPAIAEDVDSFIYDRQAMPDGYQDTSGRTPRTTNQYRSIEDNARRLLDNQDVINTLKEAGYTADHITGREMYDDLAERARKREVERRAKEDNAARVQKVKLEEAAKGASKRYGFEV